MTRNLKTLGLALVAALALSALAASTASASPALFTCNVAATEFCEIHSEPVGTETFTINGLAFTCGIANGTGFLENNEVHIKGSSSTYITLTPKYETCHVNVIFVTRTITITHNGCYYTYNATKNTLGHTGTVTPFSADKHLKCPPGKSIEMHIYNTSNANDTGAAVLCTYDIVPQTVLDTIELTNIAGTPDDILAHISTNTTVENTIKSGTCGNNAHETMIYKGTTTTRGTNEAKQFVNTTVS